jgi:uncharacterized surface protein with fasciclin (FAS1) repeats
MDRTKKIVAVFAVMALVIAFTAPAMAQTYGGQQAMPRQGGQQAMPQQGQQGGLPQSNKDLMATMETTPQASLFAAAVKAAGYDTMLGQQGQAQYMVFAPTDKALKRDMGITDASALESDPSMARSLVENCIISQVTEPQQGSNTMTMTTLGGKQITATKSSSGIIVDGINVVDAVMATNGMLAMTDGVVGQAGG